MNQPKVLAFVLPQFHRIPENDRWWGEGFTEWTNVKKAKAFFRGHYQPRVPTDKNYYDLSNPAVHDWQAKLAREHGVHGFCYYHYWFNDKQLLQKPVELMLERGKPDMPFCLAWANEPWTRAWDGSEREVLMPQTYGEQADWQRHFDYLLRAFRDPRYLRVNGKPVFLIYRTTSIENLEPMLRVWRGSAEREGLRGLHIVDMKTGFEIDKRDALFDAHAEFEPMFTIAHGRPWLFKKREKWINRFSSAIWRLFGRGVLPPNSYDYGSLWRVIAERKLPPNTYPGAFLDWDNSPRRGLHRSLILRNFDREAFKKGFAAQLCKARQAGAEFVFVNAWNEWAEGTYFEPDERRGAFFLESVRDAQADHKA